MYVLLQHRSTATEIHRRFKSFHCAFDCVETGADRKTAGHSARESFLGACIGGGRREKTRQSTLTPRLTTRTARKREGSFENWSLEARWSTVDDEVLERRLLKQSSAYNGKSVEPPARLVQALGHEIRRKSLRKLKKKTESQAQREKESKKKTRQISFAESS